MQAILNLPVNAQWVQEAVTVAGGNEQGFESNQLNRPYGLYIDDDQTILIADYGGNRIVEWKPNAVSGQVVAGGNGRGDGNNQLNQPTDVIVDEKTGSLIICDALNERVVRWSRQNGTSGETIIKNIACWGLTTDHEGFLYVSIPKRGEVRRYKMPEESGGVLTRNNGIVIAGGHGTGHDLAKLDFPTYIFVDQEQSVYVSDSNNHRVMKWVKGATEGLLVAGGQDERRAVTQLSNPRGVFVDDFGTVYVADQDNHRIMCWKEGSGEVIIPSGGNCREEQTSQLHQPCGLSFDQNRNLYVVDSENHRVQRFSIKASCTDEVLMNINRNSAEDTAMMVPCNTYEGLLSDFSISLVFEGYFQPIIF